MVGKVNERMVSAAKELLEQAIEYGDAFPHTIEGLVTAMLHAAMENYEPPLPPAPQPKNKSEIDKDGYVYFVSDGEAIKIGKAKDPKSRVSGIQTSTAKPLTILGVAPGGRRLERALHRQFDDIRIRGEWFMDTPELRAVIAERGAHHH